MQLLTHASQLRRLDVPVMLAAGFFDGVHRGHQDVLNATVERAREAGGQAWALTFDRHAFAVLAPSKAPPLLNTLEGRLARLEALGLDGVLLLPFTRALALLTPEAFVKRLCGEESRAHPPCLSEIRCGANWRFGRRAEGTPESLEQYGRAYGFRVVVVKYAEYQGAEISSTRIRQAIAEGRVADARAMLGYPYALTGTVVRGRGAGRQLGFATANIRPLAAVLPPPGVYATRTRVGGTVYNSVSNFGTAPTFAAPAGPALETHLLGYPGGDLYGQSLEVSLLARLRDERTFDSPADLTAQVRRDIRNASVLKDG
ncbi:MAG: riboflavin biosynthesis protein RibF [Kiritimatiellaeota bacterium]|nr:riboflavin biosynthesis protein RibF [Kiritimatiellota bacterium]